MVTVIEIVITVIVIALVIVKVSEAARFNGINFIRVNKVKEEVYMLVM